MMKNLMFEINENKKLDSSNIIRKYYFGNQIIPLLEIMILLFFIEVNWARSIVLELINIFCFTIYVLRLIYCTNL